MLESPHELLSLAVLLFSAAFYPLGIMLGSSCSPCCTDPCDEFFEFNRCVRFSRSTGARGELRGFSRAATTPSDAGATKVNGQWSLTLQFNFYSPGVAEWDMRVGTATATSQQHVEAYLRGEESLTATINGVQYEVEVQPSHNFCQRPLCGTAVLTQTDAQQYSYGLPPYGKYYPFLLGDVVETTATWTPAQLPQTWTTSDERGSTTYTNLCYGQDSWPPVAMRLGYGCNYYAFFSSCQSLFSAVQYSTGRFGEGQGSLSRQVPLSAFYAGDLLWTLENGPAFTTYTDDDAFYSTSPGTVTLGGNDAMPYTGFDLCPLADGSTVSRPPYGNGMCPNPEVELEILQPLTVWSVYSLSSGIGPEGVISAGTYVLQRELTVPSSDYGWGPYYQANGGCNTQAYLLRIESGAGWSPTSAYQAAQSMPLWLRRGRNTWCSPWNPWFFAAEVGFSPFGGYLWNRTVHQVNGVWQYLQTQEGTHYRVGYDGDVPAPSPSVTPLQHTISASGGTVSATFCCPNRSVTYTIPQNNDRDSVLWLLDTDLGPQRGATSYLTQSGRGASHCPFSVTWVRGVSDQTGNTGGDYIQITLAQNLTCPVVGRVTFLPESACDWAVVSEAEWLSASKSTAGMLELEPDGNTPTVYGTWRQADIVVTAGQSSQRYRVFQGRNTGW